MKRKQRLAFVAQQMSEEKILEISQSPDPELAEIGRELLKVKRQEEGRQR